jgi:S1-C subfamily serine protease
VDISGKVVGINTWIASNTGANQGYGFAIPINSARRTIDDFIETGKVQYAWLGVQIQTPNEEISSSLGVGTRGGALVSQVFVGAPAYAGGIIPGDLIVSLNGRETRDHMALTDRLGDLPPGRPARIQLIRQGEEMTLSIRLAVREDERAIAAQNKNLWPGLAVFPLTEGIRQELGVSAEKGVIIYDVIEETKAQLSGFEPEDIITQIGDRAVESLKDFYGALASADAHTVTVEREGEIQTLELKK